MHLLYHLAHQWFPFGFENFLQPLMKKIEQLKLKKNNMPYMYDIKKWGN